MKNKRYCLVIELKENHVDEYKNIHINAWPELLKAEKAAGMKEELIWIYKNLSILYIECEDIDRVFKICADNDVEKKWNITVCPWFDKTPVLDGTEKVKTLEKIFDLNQQLAGKLEQF